jgi:hypothetical protein
MKAFFDKLERAAGRMVEQLDAQTQDTTVRVLTGEVFTHGSSPRHADAPPAAVEQPAITPPMPHPEPVIPRQHDAPSPSYTPATGTPAIA